MSASTAEGEDGDEGEGGTGSGTHRCCRACSRGRRVRVVWTAGRSTRETWVPHGRTARAPTGGRRWRSGMRATSWFRLGPGGILGGVGGDDGGLGPVQEGPRCPRRGGKGIEKAGTCHQGALPADTRHARAAALTTSVKLGRSERVAGNETSSTEMPSGAPGTRCALTARLGRLTAGQRGWVSAPHRGIVLLGIEGRMSGQPPVCRSGRGDRRADLAARATAPLNVRVASRPLEGIGNSVLGGSSHATAIVRLRPAALSVRGLRHSARFAHAFSVVLGTVDQRSLLVVVVYDAGRIAQAAHQVVEEALARNSRPFSRHAAERLPVRGPPAGDDIDAGTARGAGCPARERRARGCLHGRA
jgi:hypothetical protein